MVVDEVLQSPLETTNSEEVFAESTGAEASSGRIGCSRLEHCTSEGLSSTSGKRLTASSVK